MAQSDYGATLTKGGSAIGSCRVIDYPEIKTDKIESTAHDSSGVRTYIPSGLIGLEDITLEVILTDSILLGMYSAMAAKTVDSVVITNLVDTLTFNGFYTSIKVEAADATAPDVIKATVVISPAGGVTISS